MAAAYVDLVRNKDQQVRHVVECLGLGLLAIDVVAVTSSKLEFELGFDGAWRSWPEAARFPAIDRSGPGTALWSGIARSARGRNPIIVWDRDRWSAPRIAIESFGIDDSFDVLLDGDSATRQDWISLARAFAATFADNDIETR